MNNITVTSTKNTTSPNKNNKKYIDGGIVSGTTLLGVGLGHRKYKKDTVEIRNSIGQLKEDKDERDFPSLIKKTQDDVDRLDKEYKDAKKQTADKIIKSTQEFAELNKMEQYNTKGVDKIIDELVEGSAEFYSKFLFPIERLNEGKPADMPNCIMLEGERPKASNKLAHWLGDVADCDYKKVKNDNLEELQTSLGQSLLDAEENYKSTKKRTLIHVDGFDKLINPKINSFENIESIKGVMDSCAKLYHSTIIFSTDDPSKLNNETMQPHRVTPIKIDKDITSLDVENFVILHTRREDVFKYHDDLQVVLKNKKDLWDSAKRDLDSLKNAKDDQAKNSAKLTELTSSLKKGHGKKMLVGGLIGLAVGGLGILAKDANSKGKSS